MTDRIFNFSAGPATLPVPVLERAREELLSFNGIGMSVMEISHRSKHFQAVIDSAVDGIRSLLGVPEDYEILFLQGGATLQFSMMKTSNISLEGFDSAPIALDRNVRAKDFHTLLHQ